MSEVPYLMDSDPYEGHRRAETRGADGIDGIGVGRTEDDGGVAIGCVGLGGESTPPPGGGVTMMSVWYAP